LYFSWKEFIAFYSYFVVTVKLDSFKWRWNKIRRRRRLLSERFVMS
jgi:hypothetical protein